MNTVNQLALSTFKRLAKELKIKIIDCTLSEKIPWRTTIAPHGKNGRTELYVLNLYMWSWKKGFVEKYAMDAKIELKADFDLYRIKYLVQCELKKNPLISHIGILQSKTYAKDGIEKTEESFKFFPINKSEIQD